MNVFESYRRFGCPNRHLKRGLRLKRSTLLCALRASVLNRFGASERLALLIGGGGLGGEILCAVLGLGR